MTVHNAPSRSPRLADSARASVGIVPALNEAKNLPHIAERMPAIVDEIVFVNGNSTDDTDEVARKLWPDAIRVHQTRRGKGNALACGLAAEIPLFVATLMAGVDYAKGSRFVLGGSVDITPFRRMGNHGLNGLVNVLFPATFTDLCYGYNAFWRSALDVMDLPDVDTPEPQWGDGFEIETLINTRVAAAGLRIAEVPGSEGHRIHGESNLNAVRDGLRVLRTIGHEFMRTRAARKRPVRTPVPQQAARTDDGVQVPPGLQLV